MFSQIESNKSHTVNVVADNLNYVKAQQKIEDRSIMGFIVMLPQLIDCEINPSELINH